MKTITTRYLLVAASLCLVATMSNSASADKPHKSKGKSYGHRSHPHGHNRGQTFIGISPGGVSFGYQDRNFGIQVGPIGRGYGVGNFGGPFCEPVRPVIVEPVLVEPVPVFAQPAYPQPVVVEPGIVNGQPYPAPLPQRVPRQATIVPVSPDAAVFQRDAERLFIEGRYEDSAGLVKHALVEDGDNGYLHLFDSQAKLAIGDYGAAMIALEKATQLLPHSELGYVISRQRDLYPTDHYDRHLKRLASQLAENDGGRRATLLGYHYAFLGFGPEATRLLSKAIEQDPENVVARKLLTGLSEEIPLPRSR